MPIWFALFRLLQTPLNYLDSGSGLGVALKDGTAETFLGMDLSVTPSVAIGSGIMVALPYLIMIALMVATQYVQQWHSTYGQERPSGQPGAGAQQAITKIMPLFIGFISWNFPAGLILYWATGNLFRLGQQALIFKIDGRPTPMGKTTEEPKQIEGSDPDEVKKPQQGAANKRRRRRRR
jgi:YidC/Oxa1 family membrane protein insertase